MNETAYINRMEAMHELRKDNEQLIAENAVLVLDNIKLKGRIETIESLAKKMVEAAGAIGIRPDVWDVQQKEWKQWDL